MATNYEDDCIRCLFYWRHNLKWGPKIWDLGPKTPGSRNWDPSTPGPRTRGPRTQDKGPRTSGPRNPKLATLGLWTFLLNFKIKGWKVRNCSQVNVTTQSTLSHSLTLTYFSRVKVCFWNFYEDSGYHWVLFEWFF